MGSSNRKNRAIVCLEISIVPSVSLYVATLFFLILFPIDTRAQSDTTLIDYRVYFNSKKDVDRYLDEPTTMLSERSLRRRQRQRQHIALNYDDVPISPAYIEGVRNLVAVYIAKSKWFNGMHIKATKSQMEGVRALPYVREVVVVRGGSFSSNFSDPLGSMIQSKGYDILRSNTEFSYGYGADQIQLQNGQALHRAGFTGKGIYIAVIDGGFRFTDKAKGLKALFEEQRIGDVYDFVLRKPEVFDDAVHGTNVLSVMANMDPGYLVGTAPQARYALYKSEDIRSETPSEESYWVEAAERADSVGVDIINTSLGYRTYDKPYRSYSDDEADGKSFMSRGMYQASRRGMLVVVSAGNNGADTRNRVLVPADARGVLTVGATDREGTRAFFSSVGSTADGRIKPNVAAMGSEVVVAGAHGSYSYASGTSLSSPVISGLAACAWQKNPDWSSHQLLHQIEAISSNYHRPDSLLGYGIPNFAKLITSGYLEVLSREDVLKSEGALRVSTVQGRLVFHQKMAGVFPLKRMSFLLEGFPFGIYVVSYQAAGHRLHRLYIHR